MRRALVDRRFGIVVRWFRSRTRAVCWMKREGWCGIGRERGRRFGERVSIISLKVHVKSVDLVRDGNLAYEEMNTNNVYM